MNNGKRNWRAAIGLAVLGAAAAIIIPLILGEGLTRMGEKSEILLPILAIGGIATLMLCPQNSLPFCPRSAMLAA